MVPAIAGIYYFIMANSDCLKTFAQCRDLLCRRHGLGLPKRFVGLRQDGETDEQTQQRLYEEAMGKARA